jgi:hypothetical protein
VKGNASHPRLKLHVEAGSGTSNGYVTGTRDHRLQKPGLLAKDGKNPDLDRHGSPFKSGDWWYLTIRHYGNFKKNQR